MGELPNEKRKLAAVLSADVVGYSRLMAADESATLAALKGHLGELIAPAIAAGGGRIVKTTGDGLLAEFDSAVGAVVCARDLQRALIDRNADIDPEKRIVFRMGINLGEIIVDDGDIFGDGVNIAARLQALADPGGLCVSGKVLEEVKSRLDIAYQDRGPQRLKNIPDPVNVYAVDVGSAAQAIADRPEPVTMMTRPAVAVLPFTNMSGEAEQAYFADGLTEDIITALTHWRSFPVIARNSTFTYKDRSVDITRAARELGARYVLEGSVRKSGRRVRISAQLIDGETGHHIWAEKYDRELDDIFVVQDDMTERIAAIIAPELDKAEIKRATAKRPEDLDAWDYHLRGMAAVHEFTATGNVKAREMFEKAIAIRPDYADAHAGLAFTYNRDLLLQCTEDRMAAATKAVEAARRAVALDEASATAHQMLSTAYQWLDRQDDGLAEAKRAVALNPNDARGLHALGNKGDLAGEPEGISHMEKAQKLNPQDPQAHAHLTFLARAYLNAGAYKDAVDRARRAIQHWPEYPNAHFILAIALGHLERKDEALAALQRCDELLPGFVESRRDWSPYVDPASNRRLQDGLRALTTDTDRD